MKVRVGYGLGTQAPTDPTSLAGLVDELERLGFDSLWLSERLTGPAPDPVVGLAFAAARTTRLKFGTSVMVLPGRNPVVLAKELATLDRLSDGRLLPAFGLGVRDPAEQQAFGVARGERAAWFDEVLPLLRRMWSEDAIDHDGPRFSYRGLTVQPKPAQAHMDVWLGGQSDVELRRCGRLGDGWLPSFCLPGDVAAGIPVIEGAARVAGREIDPEHYGALVAYLPPGIDPGITEQFAARVAARRPGTDPTQLLPAGHDAVRVRLEGFVEVGATKFVLVPVAEPPSWPDELGALAEAVLPLET